MAVERAYWNRLETPGYPVGHLISALAAIQRGETPNGADTAAIEAFDTANDPRLHACQADATTVSPTEVVDAMTVYHAACRARGLTADVHHDPMRVVLERMLTKRAAT